MYLSLCAITISPTYDLMYDNICITLCIVITYVTTSVCSFFKLHYSDEKSKIPFSYMLYAYSVKRAYRGTKPEESFWMRITCMYNLMCSDNILNHKCMIILQTFIFFSTGSDSRFWEFHPSSVILGVFVFFLS